MTLLFVDLETLPCNDPAIIIAMRISKYNWPVEKALTKGALL